MKPEEKLVLDLSQFVATVDGKLDLSSMVQALVSQQNLIRDYQSCLEEIFFMVNGYADRPMLQMPSVPMFGMIYNKLHKILKENESKRVPGEGDDNLHSDK